MIHQVSRQITRSLINNDIIKFDDVSVYQYGLEVLIMTIAKFTGLFLIGLLTGYLIETIVFILAFSSIRIYAGGYHASTVFKCFMLSLFFLSLDIIACQKLMVVNNSWISIASAGVALLVIYKLAPVEVVTRPISERERLYFRKLSLLVTTVFFIAVVYFSINNLYLWYVGVFAMGMLIEALTLIIEKTRKEIVG